MVFNVWGLRFGWDWVPSEGSLGGLISIQNEDVIRMEDVKKSRRVLATNLLSTAEVLFGQWCTSIG